MKSRNTKLPRRITSLQLSQAEDQHTTSQKFCICYVLDINFVSADTGCVQINQQLLDTFIETLKSAPLLMWVFMSILYYFIIIMTQQ